MEHVQVPPNFDPWSQNLNFTVSDGEGGWVIVTKNMMDLDQYRYYGFRLAISYGAGFGASLMLFLILILMTKADRRKSFVFLLNAACVFTNAIRCLLFGTWVTGEFYNPYTVLSQDWSHITNGDFATHITINIFGILVNALVFISLSLQVWIVCITTPALQRTIIMAVTTIMAGVSFGYRVAAVYCNTKLTLAYQPTDSIEKLVSTSYMLQLRLYLQARPCYCPEAPPKHASVWTDASRLHHGLSDHADSRCVFFFGIGF
jgi:pheromone alpha factor receptor